MKIGVPVAQYHPGSAAEYVVRALTELGHLVYPLGISEFYAALEDSSWDLFFGVDCGAPFDFRPLANHNLEEIKLAFWFIDYRHNKDRTGRIPNDEENARALAAAGATIFQAQYEDYIESRALAPNRVFWLPLAADPKVWRPYPMLPLVYDLGFCGNVWDETRAEILTLLTREPTINFAFPGAGKLWQEAGAQLLAQCKAGFNVNTFYGTQHCFDINMRVFETLSCARPLITNEVPSLWRIFPKNAPYLRTYSEPMELLTVVKSALADEQFLQSGAWGREFIINYATYSERMRQALALVFELPLS